VKIYGVVPGDARKSPRVALDVAATVMAAGGGPSWVVRVRNVGEGGLLLLGLPAEVGAGTRIEVRCEGGGLAKPLAAQATVVWRAGQEAGAAFTGLDPDTAAALAARVAAPEGR
jgi:hypothetical protein